MTQSTLKKKFWWWTCPFEQVFGSGPNAFQKHFLINEWDFGSDHVAFSYELARRANRALNLRAYPELTFPEFCKLSRLFSAGKSRAETCCWYNANLSEEMPFSPGFSSPSVFRLDVPTNTLKKVFLRFIREERARFNIKPKRFAGETNRKPKWDYCEELDKFYFVSNYSPAGRDPERVHRRAKAKAKALSDEFLKAVKSWRATWPEQSLWPEIPDDLITQSNRR